MQDVLWLFPVIFMVHEMEEIIGLRIWLEKNIDITKKYSRISKTYQNITTEAFSVAVLEEYLLTIIITTVSIYFKIYLLWIGVFIAFAVHLVIHIISSIIIRRYIPALVTSILLLPISLFLINKVIIELHYSTFSVIIASLLCFIIMLINLMFIHKLMRKVSEKFNN
jgi:hypothetical protein